jgi:hypothetical protein
MTLRRFIFEDFGLKLFSLGVALLIWAAVHFAVQREADLVVTPLTRIVTRTFLSQPVLVVPLAAEARTCKVRPSHVDVTVRGDVIALDKLQDHNIHVIVDLTNTNSARGLRQRVEVSTPSGVTLQVRTTPEEVEVIFPK